MYFNKHYLQLEFLLATLAKALNTKVLNIVNNVLKPSASPIIERNMCRSTTWQYD